MRELQLVMRVRPIDVAAAVSILLHVLLFTLTPRRPNPEPFGPVINAPMNVVLAPAHSEPAPVTAPEPSVPAAPASAAPQPATRAPPPVIARRPTPLPPRFPPVPIPRPLAGPRPPTPVPVPSPEPPVDMMAAVEARRAQRRASEAAMARGAPSAAKPEDAADRNLQTLSGREGVGGVFQVLRKGVRSGEFAFNGFRREGGQKQWREVIEVDAGVGCDVELAMVRRMIELIRTHYTGDFQWESHRLGRIVVLSARRDDQLGLEEFLMKEFFGTPMVNPRR